MISPRRLCWFANEPLIAARFAASMADGVPWSPPWFVRSLLSPQTWESMQRRLLVPYGESIAAASIRDEVQLRSLILPSDLASDWALSAGSLWMLWKLAEARRPRVVLEMGSGVSTLLFAAYARKRAMANSTIPRVISLDHDVACLAETRRRLSAADLESWVDLRLAPLEEFPIADRVATCYSRAALEDALSGDLVDLCLIDGPPGNVGREACLPLVVDFVASKAVFVLDDVARDPERAALDAWRRRYRAQIRSVRLVMTTHGMARFEWRQSERDRSAMARPEVGVPIQSS